MTKQIQSLNDFVLNFLGSSTDPVAEWESPENQEELKGLMSKLRPKVQRNGKKVKDPLKPKRSKSSYLFFCQAMDVIICHDLYADIHQAVN